MDLINYAKQKEQKKYETNNQKGTIRIVNQPTPTEQRNTRNIWKEKNDSTETEFSNLKYR